MGKESKAGVMPHARRAITFFIVSNFNRYKGDCTNNFQQSLLRTTFRALPDHASAPLLPILELTNSESRLTSGDFLPSHTGMIIRISEDLS